MTTDYSDVQRITPDEAVAALTAGAFHCQPDGDDLARGVEAVRKLCAPTGAGEDRRLYARDVLAVLDEAVGTPRAIVHCRMSFTGADWDLASAVALARSAGAECAWVDNVFARGHDLAVLADGRMYHFGVKRPKRTEGE